MNIKKPCFFLILINFKVLKKEQINSKVGKKKLRILLSIFLANVTVLTDLLIIVVFSRILGKDLTSENVIVDFVLNNKYLLPIIIIFRFIAIYIEKTTARFEGTLQSK